MRAHTLKRNPPKKSAHCAPAWMRGKSAKRAPLKKNPPEPKIRVTTLGKAMRLDYVHAANGKGYTHKFTRRAPVHTTADGRFLIIGPVSVKPFIED